MQLFAVPEANPNQASSLEPGDPVDLQMSFPENTEIRICKTVGYTGTLLPHSTPTTKPIPSTYTYI